MSTIAHLAANSKNFSVLYVEDNRELNEKVHIFLKKFFGEVYIAYDGVQGLKAYRKFTPDIVVTDIKMPKLDGIAMTQKIKYINPNAKVIILSAYDDKGFLYTAIELGVFRFLKKPVQIEDFTKVLSDLVVLIKHEMRVESLKQYQSGENLVAIFADKSLKLANNEFLEFYGADDEEHFNTLFSEKFDKIFIEVEDFLYSSSITWYEKVIHNIDTTYQVYTKNAKDEYRHLVLKAHFLHKNAFGSQNDVLFNFTDITDLNLIPNAQKINSYEENAAAALKLLKHLQQNASAVNLHNFYKGLTITNTGKIAFVSENRIALKTTPNQQKAIIKQGMVVISSSLLPEDILCDGVESVDRDNFITTMKHYRLIDTTPTKRKTIRVEPAQNYKARMVFNEKEFEDIGIDDLSIEAIKVSLNALPAGLNKGAQFEVFIDFYEKEEIVDSFTFSARVMNFWMQNFLYKVVAMFETDTQTEKKLLKYISQRQLELIREFKSL
jgi:YesN/AraC family two-component response regulator